MSKVDHNDDDVQRLLVHFNRGSLRESRPLSSRIYRGRRPLLPHDELEEPGLASPRIPARIVREICRMWSGAADNVAVLRQVRSTFLLKWLQMLRRAKSCEGDETAGKLVPNMKSCELAAANRGAGHIQGL